MPNFSTNDAVVQETATDTDIYVIAAHPAWRESRVNRPMMDAAYALPRVQVQDLYSSYPDYAIDVAREQAAMTSAQLIVLLHPIHWYSMPALQKLWLDEVLAYGWAYGEGGSALEGKDLWLVATTGGPESSYHPQGYNRYFFDAFLPPYEQSAALCGMRFLPPLILHSAHNVAQQAVTGHVETFRQRLASYPEWPEMDDIEQCAACVVPMKDRPIFEDATAGGAVRSAGPPQASAAHAGDSAGPPQASTAPAGGSEAPRGSSALDAVKSVGAR